MTPIALIVEDDPCVRSFVKDVLENQHFDIIEAETEMDGWRFFLEREKDIRFIFTDVNLKEGNGWHLFKKIRDRSNSPYIVISSAFPCENKKEFPLGHSSQFLLKPFPLDALIDAAQMAVYPSPHLSPLGE
ncbi:MAG: response regulator [Candidatus Omnitrophota bacterium]